MEIVKAFNSNNLHTEIVIKGTYEDPLFRANDIGLILELTNIRASIANFNDKDKVVISVDTLGGKQQMSFLTESGLYKVLFKSNKPIAEQFQNWICDVIKELRLQGTYTIQKQLEEKNEEIQRKNEEMKKQDEELKKKEEDIRKLQEAKGKLPMIYIYNTDITQKNAPLKIGMTNTINERTKKFLTHPNGKLIFNHEIQGDKHNLRNFEQFIHRKFKNFRFHGSEVFKINEDEAIVSILTDILLYELYEKNRNDIDRQQKIQKIYEAVNSIINNIPKITNEMSCQTEPEIFTEPPLIQAPTELNNPEFDNFIKEHCIVRTDVEVSAKKIIGLYRVLKKNKKRSVTDELMLYLKTKFRYEKLKIQDKNQTIHGFSGVCLKEIIYKKQLITCDEETFIFEKYIFTPDGTCSYKEMVEEYIEWKNTLNKQISGEENKTLKKYLDKLPHVMYDSVNTPVHSSCQGYYGLKNKKHEKIERKNTSTAKTIQKCDINNNVLSSYESIAKTADTENMCSAKMSRSVKDKRMFKTEGGEEYYFRIAPHLIE